MFQKKWDGLRKAAIGSYVETLNELGLQGSPHTMEAFCAAQRTKIERLKNEDFPDEEESADDDDDEYEDDSLEEGMKDFSIRGRKSYPSTPPPIKSFPEDDSMISSVTASSVSVVRD